jgi:hypothetical protein
LRAAVAQLDVANGTRGEVGREKIETLRRQVLSKGRRMVWQWRRDLKVEWTGEASGNRIRWMLVRDSLPQVPEHCV